MTTLKLVGVACNLELHFCMNAAGMFLPSKNKKYFKSKEYILITEMEVMLDLGQGMSKLDCGWPIMTLHSA